MKINFNSGLYSDLITIANNKDMALASLVVTVLQDYANQNKQPQQEVIDYECEIKGGVLSDPCRSINNIKD